MADHARLAPSNTRWPHCPGSVREEERYPDIPGEAAIDGTGSHLLLALCIDGGTQAKEWEGKTIGVGHEDSPQGWYVDADRAKRVQTCLDYLYQRVAEYHEKYPGHTVDVLSEIEANPGRKFGRDDWYGTADVVIEVRDQDQRPVVVEVIDYKDGRGLVSPKSNTQLLSYHLGVAFLTAPGLGYETIVQPRLFPPVKLIEVPAAELLAAGERLSKAAAATDDPHAPLVPDGKQGKGYCRWCKHRDNCDALVASIAEEVTTMPITDISHVAQLLNRLSFATPEELGEALDLEPAIQDMFDRIRVEAQRRLEAGQPVTGYALRPGRRTRKWAEDDDAMIQLLTKSFRLKKGEVAPPTLKSPAQIEKLGKLSDKQIERLTQDYVVFTEAAPKVAPVKREAPEDMFSDALQPAKAPVSFI